MKRFRSNLQQLHDVCRQQVRMLELDLMRKTTAVNLAREQLEQAVDDRARAEETVAATLGRRTPTATLQGALVHLAAAGQHIEHSRKQLSQRQSELEQARQEYRQVQAREEGLSRLIARQREEHQILVLREQQLAIDESAARRWRSAAVVASPVGERGGVSPPMSQNPMHAVHVQHCSDRGADAAPLAGESGP